MQMGSIPRWGQRARAQRWGVGGPPSPPARSPGSAPGSAPPPLAGGSTQSASVTLHCWTQGFSSLDMFCAPSEGPVVRVKFTSTELIRAQGNPDTGAGHPLPQALSQTCFLLAPPYLLCADGRPQPLPGRCRLLPGVEPPLAAACLAHRELVVTFCIVV